MNWKEIQPVKAFHWELTCSEREDELEAINLEIIFMSQGPVHVISCDIPLKVLSTCIQSVPAWFDSIPEVREIVRSFRFLRFVPNFNSKIIINLCFLCFSIKWWFITLSEFMGNKYSSSVLKILAKKLQNWKIIKFSEARTKK